ncbi:hypothetical protein [Singulisphaera sp. PoT]|uniref:hypothetical protein n=1 Tax=Singulisphaera sp. PoT TaxID=3411797 RepID=UPI003BF52362
MRTPDLDQITPGGSPGDPATATIHSILIQGKLNGSLSLTNPNGLSASIDSVSLGGGPSLPGNTIKNYDFPIPLADLKFLGTSLLLVIPTDGWGNITTREKDIQAEALSVKIPEPSAMVSLRRGSASWDGGIGVVFMARDDSPRRHVVI